MNQIDVMIIKATGEQSVETLPIPVDMTRVRTIVGGDIELVRVLNGDSEATLIVNEEGLIRGLPRNQAATDIYLSAVRRAFPDAANPSKAAREQYLAEMKECLGDVVVATSSPPGYDEDPYIAGDVVLIPVSFEKVDQVFYGSDDDEDLGLEAGAE